MKKFDQFLQQLTFNVRRDKEIDLNRRGFIASSMGLMGLMFVSSIPLVSQAGKENAQESEKTVKIAELDELAVGDSKTFSYLDEDEPALLIRTNADEYRAYNIKCTHLQCPVYYDKPTNQMVCPCHHGFFSVEDGAVIAGPPQRPLPSIRLEQRQDGIYAVGMEGRTV
ncbi:Rieske 2Fe-2S domain-containing protein [Bacillus sp. DNRA2]|uniref:QcrA and Rieske domain-containing protein n=1 Tax=Bacillus sp. DNRA2 TaxID=2723053 RepID=UPI00145CC545|nr:Rieske 2Fe-2S domain-containing protein [Bacillus sp. DNRA2]NMD69207.1 Rieske 2Fe-2S domain-containing protein [Bacillus sp. DNRA2]